MFWVKILIIFNLVIYYMMCIDSYYQLFYLKFVTRDTVAIHTTKVLICKEYRE